MRRLTEACEPTPEEIAAAWAVVRDRYPKGQLMGPGPGFREAIAAAFRVRFVTAGRRALDEGRHG
jgi:hypothetical protein